ncbi:MAG: ABC transporter substrate-binding protein, partial [Clostridia bacterium]|nr:ABC transporter substrate-binding protein [Clostridia bacterium]
DTIKGFLRALKKAFEFLNTHTEREVAEAIVKQFPSTTITALEASVKSYKRIDAWQNDMRATEKSFERLQKVMINAGELTEAVPFNKLVNNTFVKEIFS